MQICLFFITIILSSIICNAYIILHRRCSCLLCWSFNNPEKVKTVTIIKNIVDCRIDDGIVEIKNQTK